MSWYSIVIQIQERSIEMVDFFMIMETMEDYHYIDPNDLLLCEAGLKEMPEEQENKGILGTVGGMLKTLLDQCKKIIGSILGSLKNKIDYVFLTPEEKEKFQAYQKAIQENPALGQQKVTVQDWTKIEYSYNEAFKRAEELSAKIAQKQISMEQAKQEEAEILSSVGNLLGKSGTLVTVEMALKMAAGSVESAKKIDQILQDNQLLLKKIDQQLGEGEAAKLQKKVKKYTQETYLTKLKAQIFGKKEKDIAQVLHETVDEITKLNSFSGKVRFASSHKGMIANAGKQYVKDKNFRKDIDVIMKARKEKLDNKQ